MKFGCCPAELFPLAIKDMLLTAPFDGSPGSALATAMPAQKKRLTICMFDVNHPKYNIFRKMIKKLKEGMAANLYLLAGASVAG